MHPNKVRALFLYLVTGNSKEETADNVVMLHEIITDVVEKDLDMEYDHKEGICHYWAEES